MTDHVSTSTLPLDEVVAGCREAEHALAQAVDHQQAVDAALGVLSSSIGPELLVSVYVLEHDRLWLVTQRGYDQVRDGFALDQGVMGRAVRTGESEFIADPAADPDFIAATTDLRSELAIPLGVGRPAHGVLNIETRSQTLPRAAIPCFTALAEALTPRVRALETTLTLNLSTVSRLFVYASSLRGVSAVAEMTARSLGRLLGLESVQVSLAGDAGSQAVSFWRRPRSQALPLSPAQLLELSEHLGPVASTYAVVDLEGLPLRGKLPWHPAWLVCLPLHVGGTEIGSLVGCSPYQISFDAAHGEVATLIAAHAAALLDAAQALERLQQVAVSDPLTGLLNRRGLDDALGTELERAARSGRALSIVVLDCDDLKHLNDRGGHELGDRALRLIARFVEAEKRAGDIAARLGGDEFVLVLSESDSDGAGTVAERLRLGLAGAGFDGGRGVTASFGVASYPRDGRTARALLRAADEAMYAAKRGGRNRIHAGGNVPFPSASPPSLQSAASVQRLALPPGRAGLRPRDSAL
ncbi:MAG: GGDEF domain-containing protein [Actinobacteria bacterium]|nr:GGDEF domain-containing protein [Actinomycetota bacterium]